MTPGLRFSRGTHFPVSSGLYFVLPELESRCSVESSKSSSPISTEKFRSITRAYYRDAAGTLLVYDVTKRHTFEWLSSWLEDIRQQGDTTVIVVGNKCEAEENIRAVSAEEGEEIREE
ncbi:PREDICTED: ras-related protein Rab-2-A-like [Nicotiana attenuata]|uniref:ras-related protein Rab-2-A-like n=1 Tax=Nicotiana attenuata TaxID=49451 RepID=UPI000904A03F|nr:PREDICTED: ras-related protein Rab-2-A-like [Nicotiana attenuata]